jgi:hypothetical protein
VHKNQTANLGLEVVNLKTHYYGIPVLENVAQLPQTPVWIFGTARGGDLIYNHLSSSRVPIAGFIDIAPQQNTLHRLPVLSVESFMAQHPKTVPIVLANRYFKENGSRLQSAGFTDLYNAHPLVIRLHTHAPTSVAA